MKLLLILLVINYSQCQHTEKNEALKKPYPKKVRHSIIQYHEGKRYVKSIPTSEKKLMNLAEDYTILPKTLSQSENFYQSFPIGPDSPYFPINAPEPEERRLRVKKMLNPDVPLIFKRSKRSVKNIKRTDVSIKKENASVLALDAKTPQKSRGSSKSKQVIKNSSNVRAAKKNRDLRNSTRSSYKNKKRGLTRAELKKINSPGLARSKHSRTLRVKSPQGKVISREVVKKKLANSSNGSLLKQKRSSQNENKRHNRTIRNSVSSKSGVITKTRETSKNKDINIKREISKNRGRSVKTGSRQRKESGKNRPSSLKRESSKNKESAKNRPSSIKKDTSKNRETSINRESGKNRASNTNRESNRNRESNINRESGKNKASSVKLESTKTKENSKNRGSSIKRGTTNITDNKKNTDSIIKRESSINRENSKNRGSGIKRETSKQKPLPSSSIINKTKQRLKDPKGANARRLIAGKDALIEQYPYVVSIQKGTHHWCTGALLNPRLIITTANCMWKSSSVSHMYVRAGSRHTDRGGQTAGIQEVMKHPGWKIRRDPDYDIALAVLDKTIRFSHSVHGVDLPNRAMMPAFDDAWIASWGSERRDGIYDGLGRNLQVFHARLMERDKCNNVTQRFGVTVTENFICLTQQGHRGPCTRDTGAPAVSDGVLWGMASWSIRKLCGTERFPAVFSYVASQSNMDFIANATHYLMSDERYYPFPDRFPVLKVSLTPPPAITIPYI